MSDPLLGSPRTPRTWVAPTAAFLLLVTATAILLRTMGRVWWCDCGSLFPWSWDIWSPHNSQHLIDPYSFTHISHGSLFCGLAWLFLRRVGFLWQLWIATFCEAVWEIAENTQTVIDRYRETTLALGYNGDSILNSLADIGCFVAGFLLARRLGLRWTATLFVLSELVLLVWIRDNLILNVIMLLYPIDGINAWQGGG